MVSKPLDDPEGSPLGPFDRTFHRRFPGGFWLTFRFQSPGSFGSDRSRWFPTVRAWPSRRFPVVRTGGLTRRSPAVWGPSSGFPFDVTGKVDQPRTLIKLKA